MVDRGHFALLAVSLSCFFPVAAHAGSGGTPTAPGAGKSTDYCCQVWERVEPNAQTSDATQPTQKSAPSFLRGSGCQAIAEDEFSRNSCIGTVVKCRGELFTPGTGKVERCLTP